MFAKLLYVYWKNCTKECISTKVFFVKLQESVALQKHLQKIQ